MITALRDVGEPAITNVRLFDLAELLHEVVRKVSPKRNGDARSNSLSMKSFRSYVLIRITSPKQCTSCFVTLWRPNLHGRLSCGFILIHWMTD